MPTAATAGRGRLVTIEGVEGAGKSTQVGCLAAWLERQGARVITTAEPDGTALGRGLRRLLGELGPVEPLTETLLFAASRAEHVARVVRPALEAGAIVVCDRFGDSTVAYQGYGRGVPLPAIAALNQLATGGLVPDLTIVLDLEAGEGLRRAGARRGAGPADPFEALALEFHERVRKGYWAIRDREPARVVVVDAHRPAAQVATDVAAVARARLGLELAR